MASKIDAVGKLLSGALGETRELISSLNKMDWPGDPEPGEYADPVFHVRLGQVPDSEGEES